MKLRTVATSSLRFAGWHFEGPLPSEKKGVCLALPHTSNWDGLLLVGLLQSVGLTMRWMIKDSWVKGPMSPIMRSLGALPINRSRANNVVDQMIAEFKTREAFLLGIPPEGTRKRVEFWKSGFYHIALGASVPVLPGYLDYARKRAGIGPAIHLTGRVREDMDRIRAFYADKNPQGHDPSQYGPLRLREEA